MMAHSSLALMTNGYPLQYPSQHWWQVSLLERLFKLTRADSCAGPMTGAPSSTDRSAPRPFAITEDYFHRVCPESERRKLRTEDVMALLGATATAGNMIDKWVAVYGDAPEKCIEIPSNSYQTFDILYVPSTAATSRIYAAII